MKLITYSRVGYNRPSECKWTYKIWKIDLIDTEQEHCNSLLAKETHNGDVKFKDRCKSLGVPVIKTTGVATSKGLQRISGIGDLPHIDDEDFFKDLINFVIS